MVMAVDDDEVMLFVSVIMILQFTLVICFHTQLVVCCIANVSFILLVVFFPLKDFAFFMVGWFM